MSDNNVSKSAGNHLENCETCSHYIVRMSMMSFCELKKLRRPCEYQPVKRFCLDDKENDDISEKE